jgi:hypothetical protein
VPGAHSVRTSDPRTSPNLAEFRGFLGVEEAPGRNSVDMGEIPGARGAGPAAVLRGSERPFNRDLVPRLRGAGTRSERSRFGEVRLRCSLCGPASVVSRACSRTIVVFFAETRAPRYPRIRPRVPACLLAPARTRRNQPCATRRRTPPAAPVLAPRRSERARRVGLSRGAAFETCGVEPGSTRPRPRHVVVLVCPPAWELGPNAAPRSGAPSA